MPEHQQIQQSKKPDTSFQKRATPVSQIPLSNPYFIIQRAKTNPKSLTHADVMQLQRTIGNRAVGRLLSSIESSSTAQQATVQRQEIPEKEEPLQGKMIETVQRQEIPEEEEPLQGKMIGTIQRQEIPEEGEPLQGKFEEKPKIACPSCFVATIVQRQEIPEKEEPLQGKMIETIQRQRIPEEEEPLQGKMVGTVQRQEIPEEDPLQTKRENNTGMPDNLKAGVENLSGIDMSGVRVHYNSSKPAEVGALAYTQGTDIHVSPGQERHLPHEAWHVVQQKQKKVEPTMQLKDGVSVNDDEELEHEADVMGTKALKIRRSAQVATGPNIGVGAAVQSMEVLPLLDGAIQRAGGAEQVASTDPMTEVTSEEEDTNTVPAIDPNMGSDVDSLSWFRETLVSAHQRLKQAENDATTFDLVLKSIHREYGEWFAGSAQGDIHELPQRMEAFREFEAQLLGGQRPGRFWCVMEGLEEGRTAMGTKMAVIGSRFRGIESFFKSALDAMAADSSISSFNHAEKLWRDAVEEEKQIMEDSKQVLLLRIQAETLLHQGRTKWGGSVATTAIVIDSESMVEVREAQGKGDEPLSLHQDDGPAHAMHLLKDAMVAYVLATRAKEELRTELGVDNLRKVSKAMRKTDPTVESRIAKVRKDKTEAEERYKRIRKTVDAYLAEGLPPAIETEIAEIDHTYLGVSQADASEHLTHAKAVRSDQADIAKKLGKVTDQLVISEAKFARLRRSIAPLAVAGVGARNFGINIGVSFSFGIGKGSEIKVGGGIKYSGTTDLQDDRRLRVSHALGVYGKGSAELAAVVEASAGAELMKGKTEVFMDADHWAASMAYRFESISKQISNLHDSQKLIRDELSAEQAERVLSTSRLAEDGVTQVDSTSVSGSLAASVLGIGVSGSYEKKWMTFSKAGKMAKKQAKQTTKTLSVSPGSNVAVTLTRTIIEDHANPDNDGKYWNIKLELTGTASASFMVYTKETPDAVYGDWEQGLRKALGTNPMPSSGGSSGFGTAEEDLVGDVLTAKNEGFTGDVVQAVSTYLGAEVVKIESKVKSVLDASVALKTSRSLGVEWNFMWSDAANANELQYRRTSGSKSTELSGSAPVYTEGGASLSVDVSFSKGQSLMRSEKLGDSTLTYLQTVFNGLHPRDMRDRRLARGNASEWSDYVDGHRKEVWVALCRIGAGRGGAYEELKNAVEKPSRVPRYLEIKAGEALRAAKALMKVASDELKEENPRRFNADKFAIVKDALTTYLDKQGDMNNTLREVELYGHTSESQY